MCPIRHATGPATSSTGGKPSGAVRASLIADALSPALAEGLLDLQGAATILTPVGTPPDAVVRLVDRFNRDRKVFQSPDFKEEQLRAAAHGRQLTAFSLQPSDSDSGPSAVGRKPIADVPGQVYEPFLGKVVRLTAGHQAKVEGKLRTGRAVPHPRLIWPRKWAILTLKT